MTVRVLLTGAGGQLGTELQRRVPADVALVARDRAALDLRDATVTADQVRQLRPDVIINCAAYTAVDRAESEPAEATAVNVTGVRHLAEAAHAAGARLVHLSTDFVFGGPASGPRHPDAATAPEGVYGTTKRDGERTVLEVLGPRALVLRTAWLYSVHGSNFVKTMLRLMRERSALQVVSDQVGTPTWAGGLADAVWCAAALPALHGIHHWTDAGVASWYDFALAIQEEALGRGLLPHAIPVQPIPTVAYPTPARRPGFSVLDTTGTAAALGVAPAHWRANLRRMLDGLAHA